MRREKCKAVEIEEIERKQANKKKAEKKRNTTKKRHSGNSLKNG